MNDNGPDARAEVFGAVGTLGDTGIEDCCGRPNPQQVVDMPSAVADPLPALNRYERAVIPEREDIHKGTLAAGCRLPLNPRGKLLSRRDGNELRKRPVTGVLRSPG